MLRVGLVGAGPWARRIVAPALAAHPGVELVSVWTRRSEAAAALAAAHGARACAGLAELIGTSDAIAWAVPPAVQGSLAPEAVRAGRHVLLEKPVAADLDAARRLADAVDAAGVASVVGLILRFAPETRAWLATIAERGGWRGGSARWLSGAMLGGDYATSSWRAAEGALADVGPHVIDLMDAALGPVTAVVASTHGPGDLWQLVLAHEGGATSTVTVSMRVPVDPTVVTVDVFGAAGVLPLAARTTPALGAYALLLDEFVALIDTGRTDHPCDVHRGVRLLELVTLARSRR